MARDEDVVIDKCSNCKGTGYVGNQMCQTCGGSGQTITIKHRRR